GHERGVAGRRRPGGGGRERFRLGGIPARARLAGRGRTASPPAAARSPAEMAARLGERHFYVWNGNLYAQELSERLGLEAKGGFLRIGLVHYNTAEEVDRLLHALDEL